MLGHRGSSVARLEEAKQRSELYTRLHDLDVHVKRKVQFVHTKFADVPSYQVGQIIHEKVKNNLEISSLSYVHHCKVFSKHILFTCKVMF